MYTCIMGWLSVTINMVSYVYKKLIEHSTAGACVSLMKDSISLNENVGTVLVCAQVTSPDIGCPVAFEFDVSFLSNTRGIVFSMGRNIFL